MVLFCTVHFEVNIKKIVGKYSPTVFKEFRSLLDMKTQDDYNDKLDILEDGEHPLVHIDPNLRGLIFISIQRQIPRYEGLG